MGLVKIVVGVWGLSFLSLHILSSVSLCQRALPSVVPSAWDNEGYTSNQPYQHHEGEEGVSLERSGKIQCGQAWLVFARFCHMPNPEALPQKLVSAKKGD